MRSLPANHRAYPWLAALAGAVMIARLAASVGDFSQVIDEPCHIGGAIAMVEAGKAVVGVSHPPLTRWVVALPLLLDGARAPQFHGTTTVEREDLAYATGSAVLFSSPTPYIKILSHARVAMIVFPVLSLLYLYLLARWLTSGLVAVASVTFFSLDPTLLGHGFWVCTDGAACAGFLAAAYHGFRWLVVPTFPRAAASGLAIGLAISAKFSCAFVLPVLLIEALIRRQYKKVFLQSSLAAVIAFLSLWATYLFNVAPLADQTVLGNPPEWQHLPAWVRNTPIPMPSLFLGLARQAGHDRVGDACYLNGNVKLGGWWYYFPEVLALKSPLGFLAALTLALIFWLISKQGLTWPARAMLLPAGVFLAFSMMARIDIGIRHILPLIPFLYLFAAWQLARPRRIVFLGLFILSAALETAAVHPNYVSFFNIAAGGAEGGQRFALDSNLDWGQDRLLLPDWIKAHAQGRPYAMRLIGLRNKPLLTTLGLDPNSLDAPPHTGLLFISKNVRLVEGRLPWLARHTPIATVGTSIDVYDLTGPVSPDEPDDVPALDVPAISAR